jgi:multidrug efflux pump subunit AcrB
MSLSPHSSASIQSCGPKTKLSDYSVIMVFVALVIIGLAFMPLLNIRLKPNVSLPEITITCNWPNASAKIIETQVTAKLEQMLGNLNGITEISSESKKGSSEIVLTFNKHTNVDFAKFEAANIVRRVYPNLPKGVLYPVISNHSNNGKAPLITYSIVSGANTHDIATCFQQHVVPKIAILSGVSNIEIYGNLPFEFVVKYCPEKMVLYNISLPILQQAIDAYLQQI